MISQRSLSQHGEAMLRGTGLPKFWTVPDPSMTNGFKALHPRELVWNQPISWVTESTLRKHRMQLTVSSALSCSMRSKSIADACVRHGYCTAELIVWYVMKQLILPPDINEVTMQTEILTPPKVPPATLDQGCAWLEEMQHRLITQYYRTMGNIWDSLWQASVTRIQYHLG